MRAEKMTPPTAPLKILHEDPSIVVVEKPGGLLSVPGRGPEKQDCVVTRARSLFCKMIEQPAVHRLDMFTSGIMVLAITVEAHKNLSNQFQCREVEKIYIGLLDGIVDGDSGVVSLPFRLDPDNRPYQIYDPVHGKVGITRWKKLGVENGKTRVEFAPLTGRTHQLRLHASHNKGLGIPIVGDALYGNGTEGERMCLHAAELTFRHPSTDAQIHFISAPPF